MKMEEKPPNKTSSVFCGSFGKVCKVINCLDQQQYAVKILLRGIYTVF